MPTFRVEKKNNYTVMSNHHLRNKDLSLKAKGLLSLMLSLPDNWDYSLKGLVFICKEGEDAIREALKELEKHNYLIRNRLQDDNHKFKYEYIIYEIPYADFPYTGNEHTETPVQINNDIINIDNKDKIDKTIHPITQELINRHFIDENDIDLENYNELFKELLKNYEYKKIMICSNYILSKWKYNGGLDEFYNSINKKFAYYRSALLNNLNREDSIPEWFEE